MIIYDYTRSFYQFFTSMLFLNLQQTKMSMTANILHAFHAFVIGPAFLYAGFAPDTIPESAFTPILVLGVFIFFYHGYKAYQKLAEGRSAWINWIHVFLVAPLLIIIGTLKKEASRRYYEMLLLLGFAVTGYHGFYLIRDNVIA